MRDLTFMILDDDKVLQWYTDSDFECCVHVGDYLNIKFHDVSQNIDMVQIVDIFSDGTGLYVRDAQGSIVTRRLSDIIDMEHIYPIETEPVHFVHAVTRGGRSLRS